MLEMYLFLESIASEFKEVVATFPHHFHNRNEKNVTESDMPAEFDMQMKKFMDFIRKMLVRKI